MKQSMRNRILSFVMALLLFMSDVPFAAFPVVTKAQENSDAPQTQQELKYDYDTLKITRDGKLLSSLDLLKHEKIAISAVGLPASAKYQWQVEHPEKNGVWVNIYDGTDMDISVTLALVENVLRPDGTARLRCRAYTDTYAYISNTVTVHLVEEGAASVPAAKGESGHAVKLDEDAQDFVTVEIHYIKYEYVKHVDANGVTTYQLEKLDTPAYGSYVATILRGANFAVSVPNPVIVGYSPSWIPKDGADMPNDTVQINLTNVQENLVFEVEYRPAEVNYSIHYYFQNIYDDLYVENATLAPSVTLKGYTGDMPKPAETHKVVTGFTSLYYEPDIIAADGSTVFNVYYERNYYLMEFDCDGGYGTDTIYVRYGTYVAVADPVKTGWTFLGWDLVSRKDDQGKEVALDGDTKQGEVDLLPTSLPYYNSAYKALWTEAETSYKIAYWIVASNGDRTYIGTREVNSKTVNGQKVPIKSGDVVHGTHDLTSTMAICGYAEHTHQTTCCKLGLEEHVHTKANCFNGMILDEQGPGDNGLAAIKAYENGGNPESGYIYVVYNHAENSKSYWPKLYLDGKFYIVNGVGNDNPRIHDVSGFSSIVDGEPVAEGKTGNYGAETLTVTKYKAKTTCNKEQHIHDYSCRTCTEHTHTTDCYQDMSGLLNLDSFTYTDKNGKEVTLETAKPVTVQGDGSSVVNVYYQYKEYTLKFYYAASQTTNSKTTYYVIGGSTYYFGQNNGVDTTDDLTQLNNMFISHSSERGKTDVGSISSFFNERGTARINDKTYTQGTLEGTNGWVYHYISFNARFMDDISEKWPIDIFAPVTMASGNNNSNWGKPESVASAWNGEYYVKYSQDKQNETIKGKYERFDKNLMLCNLPQATLDKEDSVSFLCFWENGAKLGNQWNIPKLYRYKIWLEGNAPNGETTITKNNVITYLEDGTKVVRNGVTFYLADTYDTCDDSIVGKQTQAGLTGYGPCYLDDITKNDYVNKVEDASPTRYFHYTTMIGTTDAALLQNDGYYDSNLYKEGYEVNFYYATNSHSLKFYNYNGWLGGGQGAGNTEDTPGVRYGTPLSVFGAYVNRDGFMDENYPKGLEPGAYTFAGWYTSPMFLEGTEVDWATMTMPDADLTVYAKWVPVQREVYFYLTYENMVKNDPWFTVDANGNKVPAGYPIIVDHGAVLGTAYNYIPQRGIDSDGDGVEDYTFIGWFYMDEDNKKRFAPDTMEIKKDLKLFAEWQSTVDTEYTVEYVLQAEATINGKPYPAGTVLAEITTGHSTAGRTKTFTAKAGLQLKEGFQNALLFPVTNTHSILMDANPTKNKFTFEYVADDQVYYTIRYVNKATGEILGEVKDQESNQAIITVKYKHFDGFVPEQFYIQKVLAYDGDATSAKPDNIITFYYLPNAAKEALYNVEYYKWNLQTGDYELVQNELNKAEVDKPVSVSVTADKFSGFYYEKAEILTYNNETDFTTVEKNSNATQLSATLTEYGLVFKIYYKQIEYPYLIEFVDHSNNNELLGYGMLNSDQVFKLNAVKDKKAAFGSKLTYEAPAQITVNGRNYDIQAGTNQTQTMTIRIEQDVEIVYNVLTFYYQPERIDVFYHPVCTVPELAQSMWLSQSREPDPLKPTGCTVNVMPGFVFKGWYYDEACTEKVEKVWATNTEIKPPVNEIQKGDDGNEHFYALFEPIYTDLTINLSGMEGKDSVIFHIVGEGVDLYVTIVGNGSVTIRNIRVAVTYEITEENGWTWEYTDGGTATWKAVDEEKTDTKNIVSFQLTPSGSDWLNGETSQDNKFN